MISIMSTLEDIATDTVGQVCQFMMELCINNTVSIGILARMIDAGTGQVNVLRFT
jgi:hypothetical protein